MQRGRLRRFARSSCRVRRLRPVGLLPGSVVVADTSSSRPRGRQGLVRALDLRAVHSLGAPLRSDAAREMGTSSDPQGLKSYAAYKKEWGRYLEFVGDRRVRQASQAVPGRDVPWCVDTLFAFLVFRARTCKPSTLFGIISALKYCSLFCGHLLPSSKGEQPTAMRLRVHYIRRELRLRALRHAAVTGVSIAPRRALAVGAVGVAVLLAGYGVTSQVSFLSLPPWVRNYLVASVMASTGCMRFGHFSRRGYDMSDFVHRDGAWRLASDWHKYDLTSALRHQGAYVIVFPDVPELPGSVFVVRDANGGPDVPVTASMVITWFIVGRRGRSTGRFVLSCGTSVESRSISTLVAVVVWAHFAAAFGSDAGFVDAALVSGWSGRRFGSGSCAKRIDSASRPLAE